MWPSGQWQQTVNLPGFALRRFESSRLHHFTFLDRGSNSGVESQPSKLLVAGSNPVSRSILSLPGKAVRAFRRLGCRGSLARPFRPPGGGCSVSNPGRCPGLSQSGPFGPQTDLAPERDARAGATELQRNRRPSGPKARADLAQPNGLGCDLRVIPFRGPASAAPLLPPSRGRGLRRVPAAVQGVTKSNIVITSSSSSPDYRRGLSSPC